VSRTVCIQENGTETKKLICLSTLFNKYTRCRLPNVKTKWKAAKVSALTRAFVLCIYVAGRWCLLLSYSTKLNIIYSSDKADRKFESNTFGQNQPNSPMKIIENTWNFTIVSLLADTRQSYMRMRKQNTNFCERNLKVSLAGKSYFDIIISHKYEQQCIKLCLLLLAFVLCWILTLAIVASSFLLCVFHPEFTHLTDPQCFTFQTPFILLWSFLTLLNTLAWRVSEDVFIVSFSIT